MYAYNYLGLNYYIKAVNKINTLPKEEKTKAISDFYIEDGSQRSYGGILAKVDTKGGNIWVWGKSGLKKFKSDTNSFYHFTDGCKEFTINPDAYNFVEPEINLTNEVDTDIGKWKEKVKIGDWVGITSRSDIGIFGGKTAEVFGMNWWFFLPTGIKTACEK